MNEANPAVLSIADTVPQDTGPMNATGGALISAIEVARLLRVELPATPEIERIAFPTRRVRLGESLIHAGATFQSLYVVRSGTFKTVTLDPSGSDQIVAFPIKSDVVGIDGIDSGRYAADVIALEDSEVVILPFARLARLARECAGLETLVYRTLSRELVRDQAHLWMLGSLGAEARVAAFLLHLAERFGALGYSRKSFILRMTREEIGSYLGLKLETVSRTFTKPRDSLRSYAVLSARIRADIAPVSVHSASTKPTTSITTLPPPFCVTRVSESRRRVIASPGTTPCRRSIRLWTVDGSATMPKTPRTTRKAEGIARKP